MASLIKNMIATNEKTTQLKNDGIKFQTRKMLLRQAIICAKNGKSIDNISKQLGVVTHEDFMYIETLMQNFKNPKTAETVNTFLCNNLKGFKQARNTYYYALYNV